MKIIISILFILTISLSVSAAVLKVTKTEDTGDRICDNDCSLREAIYSAANGDQIIFDENYFNVPRTISLTLGELNIDKDLSIIGTAANRLNIKRESSNNRFRIFRNSGVTTIANLMISYGLSPTGTSGGGVLNTGNLTIIESEIINNGATSGAGIANEGNLTVIRSSIILNDAYSFVTRSAGGGISNRGTMMLTNCTLSSNSADSAGFGADGGGIYQSEQANSILRSVTLAQNKATSSGGGIYAANGSSINIGNTLIGDNTSANSPDVNGALNSEGYNLIENTSGAAINGITASNILGVDPRLSFIGPQYYGGTTRMLATFRYSPGTDKGKSFGLPTDQRLFQKPVDSFDLPNAEGGDGSDIGAYEIEAENLVVFYEGRLRVPSGTRGLARAIVEVSNAAGQRYTTRTNNLGYFRFRNLPTGFYTLRVKHKQYIIEPYTIFVGVGVRWSSFNGQKTVF